MVLFIIKMMNIIRNDKNGEFQLRTSGGNNVELHFQNNYFLV